MQIFFRFEKKSLLRGEIKKSLHFKRKNLHGIVKVRNFVPQHFRNGETT